MSANSLRSSRSSGPAPAGVMSCTSAMSSPPYSAGSVATAVAVAASEPKADQRPADQPRQWIVGKLLEHTKWACHHDLQVLDRVAQLLLIALDTLLQLLALCIKFVHAPYLLLLPFSATCPAIVGG